MAAPGTGKRNTPNVTDLLSGLRRYVEELDSVALAATKGPAAELATTFVDVRSFYEFMGEINTLISNIKNRMAMEDIPKSFENEGLTTITLKGGYRVTISSLVRASTRNMEEGIHWMKKCECGHDPANHEFGKTLGQCLVVMRQPVAAGSKKMRDISCSCEEYNAPNAAIVKETINASTLAAFAKAELEEGRELPEELFNVFIGQNTSVTRVGKS
jgi:hypothetical protein